VLQDVARTQRGQLQRLASEHTVSVSSPVTVREQETAAFASADLVPEEGYYSVKVAVLGEREDLSSKWEREERERVNRQVAEAERVAQYWHSTYLALALEAETTANGRKEMTKAKEDLQV
jgi:hypothetical protein